jgi:lysophospholipase L1-like esterase
MCEQNGCQAFINHFPDFFAERDRGNWRDTLYIRGDVHFSARGHRLMAQRLAATLAGVLADGR